MEITAEDSSGNAGTESTGVNGRCMDQQVRQVGDGRVVFLNGVAGLAFHGGSGRQEIGRS